MERGKVSTYLKIIFYNFIKKGYFFENTFGSLYMCYIYFLL